jgi:hypothetical protein
VGVATTWGVALHAQTLVAAMGVDTELAAGEGGAAFVYISTCPAIVFQPESRAAAALEANLKVLTVLAAATEFVTETLVDVAATLIGAITAVILAIAEQCLSHTAPTVAQEL